MKLSNDTPPTTPLPTPAAAGGAGGAGPEKPTPQPTPPKPPPASAPSAAQDTWQPPPPKEGGVVPFTGQGITTGPNGYAYGEWKVVPGAGTRITPGTHAPPRGDAHTLVVTDASGQKHDIHQGSYKLPVRGQNEIWNQPMGFDQKIPVGEKPTGGKPTRDIQSHPNGANPNPSAGNQLAQISRLAIITTALNAANGFTNAFNSSFSWGARNASFVMHFMGQNLFNTDSNAQSRASAFAENFAKSITDANNSFNQAYTAFAGIWTNNPPHEAAQQVLHYATDMANTYRGLHQTIENALTDMRTWPAFSQQVATIDRLLDPLGQSANRVVEIAARHAARG